MVFLITQIEGKKMMKKIIVLMAISLLMVGCASNKNNAQASLTPLNDKYGKPRVSPTAKKALRGELAKNEHNEVKCKKVLKTGSHIPVITCKTVAEHKSDEARSKAAVERILYDTNQNTGKFENQKVLDGVRRF